METIERKTRRSYTTEEDSTILEMVEGAKSEGMELGAVYKMMADDMDRTEGALAKRYADLKKAEREAQGVPKSLKQISMDMETLPELNFDSQPKLDRTTVQYVLRDAEATLDMYEKLKETQKPKEDAVSLDVLVDKLERVITEKIEMRIERDFYKRKYEELQMKYDKVRRLMED